MRVDSRRFLSDNVVSCLIELSLRMSKKVSEQLLDKSGEMLHAKQKVSGDGSVHLPYVEMADVGDETQLRFRYQNAYGVLILIGMKRGSYVFDKLLCEYHDDFIGISQNHICSFQVKTRIPEHGFWKNHTTEFIDAVKKFIALESHYQGAIQKYYFVSNANVLAANTNIREKHKSPAFLLDAISSAKTVDDLAPLAARAFSTIINKIKTQKNKQSKKSSPATDDTALNKNEKTLTINSSTRENEILFRVLKKLIIVPGPSLCDYESVIVDLLGNVAKSKLGTEPRNIRDELIHKIYVASAKSLPPEKRYIFPSGGKDFADPLFDSKIVSVSDLDEALYCTDSQTLFRFSPTGEEHFLATKRNPVHFDKKMQKGGIGENHLDTMRRRKISAEKHFLELQAKKKGAELDEFEKELNHLDQKIRGVCDDVLLEIETQGSNYEMPYGLKMLQKVQDDIKMLVKEHPESVCNFDYESLMGVTGLLTESCSVWWSPKFTIDDNNDFSNS